MLKSLSVFGGQERVQVEVDATVDVWKRGWVKLGMTLRPSTRTGGALQLHAACLTPTKFQAYNHRSALPLVKCRVAKENTKTVSDSTVSGLPKDGFMTSLDYLSATGRGVL